MPYLSHKCRRGSVPMVPEIDDGAGTIPVQRSARPPHARAPPNHAPAKGVTHSGTGRGYPHPHERLCPHKNPGLIHNDLSGNVDRNYVMNDSVSISPGQDNRNFPFFTNPPGVSMGLS